MRSTRLGTGAAQAFATKGLGAHNRANHVAVDINIADMGGIGQLLGARVDAGLNAQSEAIAQRVDLRHDGLRVAEFARAPAHDVQHRAEDFLLEICDGLNFKNVRRHQVCYFFSSCL